MDVGIIMFMTDYALPVTDLARALEERGFESLWTPGAVSVCAVCGHEYGVHISGRRIAHLQV